MKKSYAIIIMGFLFMTGNCATTRITSFRDPEFTGKTYNKLLIFAPFKDIESRTKMENAFKSHFVKPNLAVPSIELIMPTRFYTDDDLDKIFMENEIDGVLLLALTDSYSDKSYVPSTYKTQGYATFSGNVANYYGTTQQYGGYYVSKPRAKYALYLYDVATKKIAWISSSYTRGNAYAGFGTLANSLASETVGKLKEDGLLK